MAILGIEYFGNHEGNIQSHLPFSVMCFARFLQNEQKHIIQHEWVNVNFSGEKEHLLEFNHLFWS
jgi:hypothetical protein